ncbi:MAG: hypothetical protein LBK13_13260, partial [Spirochaetales bacterium]|nr:hypothetical protein [Spirochaetales bacterium]
MGAFFFFRAPRAEEKKPGYPFHPFLPLRGKKGFPLLSRMHGRAANLRMQIRDQPLAQWQLRNRP